MQKREGISLEESESFARERAEAILRNGTGPAVVALVGNLGAGKTTFAKVFARTLGVEEEVTSPTFVLLKIYQLPDGGRFKRLVHLDAYRLKGPEELSPLGWNELVHDSQNIILVEWADIIASALPEDAEIITIEHAEGKKRTITWQST